MELKYIILIAVIVFLLLIAMGLAIVNYSTDDLLDKFKKANRFSVGKTPFEFASLINSTHFNGKIKILYKDNLFCDSFNTGGTLTLCSKYANNNELAGLAICAHEIGHAFQCVDKKEMMKSHAKKLSVSKSVSWLISPLIISALLSVIFSQIVVAIILATFGIIVFFIAITTKLSTLKIEKDASKRALILLELYANLSEEQLIVAKEFLNSAKQTYLAELLRIMLKWTMLVKKR